MTTSRERVSRSMNFVQPDRVPVDFGGHRASGIMAMAYGRLRDYLGLPKKPVRVIDVIQQLAQIDEDVLDRFGVDVTELGRGFSQDEADWHPWVLPDGTECLIPRWINPVRQGDAWVIRHADSTPLAIQKKGMIYFEQICWPMKENPEEKLHRLEEMITYDMWAALPSPPGPVPWTEEGMRFLAEGARKFRERTSRAIVALFRATLFEGGQHMFNMDGFYYMLAGEPALAHHFLEGMTELYLQRLEMFLKAIGPYIDVISMSDDFGMQTGSQISPRMYREFFKPHHKRIWQHMKNVAPSVKIMLHSCGSLPALLPDMIDAGLEAWNPVQISAKDMEPERLKADFGRRLVLWGGGCDTQQVLRSGTAEDIKAHVWHNLDVFAPGGGYVFQQVHNIMADVPPENVTAMFDAVRGWNDVHS